MKSTHYILILLVLVLTLPGGLYSCNHSSNNDQTVYNFLTASISEKTGYLHHEFNIDLSDSNNYSNGQQSIDVLKSIYTTRSLTNSSYLNLELKEVDNSTILVTYKLESWMHDCFQWDLKFEDTYILENGLIKSLTSAELNSNSNSTVSNRIQSDFMKWANRNNLSDSLLDQPALFRNLKIYCDSLTAKTTSNIR